MKSRRGFAIQRLMNAMRQAHADGWFIVFDTLTLADDRPLKATRYMAAGFYLAKGVINV